jgi:hypothetical protein
VSTVPDPTPAAPVEPPQDAAVVVVERPCASCGAPLADGQDWCLECGAAQPGRLGGRPGWRAALTVMGATALLAVGAGAAAYAALNSDAQRSASAPPPPNATPTVAQVPPTTTTPTTPTTPPTTTTPTTPTVPAPPSEPADVPEPSTTPSTPAATPPAPSTPPTPAPTPTPSTPPTNPTPSTPPTDTTDDDDTGTDTATTETEPEPVAVELKEDFASTYDPYKRGGEAVTDPGNAVDGKNDTAWEAPVGPDGEVRIGLVISLDKATKLGDLEMKVDTPGFRVEMYATKSSELPPDVLDSRWKHVRDRKDVGVRETLKLDGEYRHVLLWITSQPADTKVAIPEIELFQQED